MKRTGFFVLALLGCIGLANAQLSDTLLLSPVEVAAPKPAFYIGYRSLEPDSLLLRAMPGANLSDVLERQGGLSLRTYGMGSLSTSAARGAGSAHTAVLWDGFSLLSPMNGLSDLALLPMFFLDDSRVQQGASVALFGSGALGAAIQLGQSRPLNSAVRLFYEGGSFGQHTLGTQLSFVQGRMSHDLRLFSKKAENNFPYANVTRFGSPREELKNAQLTAHGVLYQFGYGIGKQDSLAVKLWFQNYDRAIPPAMTAANAASVQSDVALRTQLRWMHAGEILQWQVRQMWSLEDNTFVDPLADLNELHRFTAVISELDVQAALTKHWRWQAVAHHSLYEAQSPAYMAPIQQQRYAVWSALRYSEGRWRGQLLLRQEFFEGKLVPFTPGIGLEYAVARQASLYTNASRTYRLPTLNDLYWQPGGNAGLRPELGWSGEVGVRQKFQYRKQHQEVSIGYFRQQVNDWIIWLPGGGGIWSPENLLGVSSQGIESQLKLVQQFGPHTLRLQTDYAWVKSVHTQVGPGQENRLNKQLIYVREHQLRAQLWYQYKRFFSGFLYNFTGQRFVTSDHSDALDPYQLNHLQAGINTSFGKMDINLGLQVNNLFNTNYQAVQWRPMPGRYYMLNLTLNYK